MPQDKFVSRDFPIMPSNLENIDSAVYEWLNEVLNVHSTTNKGFKKVPVIWPTAERAFQMKHKKELRDDTGTLILPLLSVQRTNIEKSLDWKGTYFGNIPPQTGFDPRGGSIMVATQIKQDKTANYQNADAKFREDQDTFPKISDKVVHQTVSIPMPRYLDMKYKIVGRSNYQAQSNELMEPFMALGGGVKYFTLKRNGHLYEVFVDSVYAPNDDAVGASEEEPRVFEMSVTLRVLGYLLGAGSNEERPVATYRESAATFKIMREHTMTQDEINAYFQKDSIFGLDGKYRE